MEIPVDTTRAHGKTFYVHLCLGDVIEVRPATSMQLTQDSVVILDGKEAVKSFPRANVYFVTIEPREPSSAAG